MTYFKKDWQYFKFCSYGFLKNLRFFEPFLMVFLLQKLDNNYTQMGFLYSLRFLFRAILEIPSGVIADTLGRKGSLVVSYCLYITSFLSYYFANSFYGLLVPTILFGVADAFRTGTHKAMIIDYLNMKGWEKHKTTYYGHTRSWSQTGSAISSLIVFFAYLLKPEYDFIFLVTTIPYFLGLINILSYPTILNRKPKDKTSKILKRLIFSTKESIRTISNPENLKKITGSALLFGYFHSIKDYFQPIVLSLGIILPLSITSKLPETSSQVLPLFYFALYAITTIASRKAGQISGLLKTDKKTIRILSLSGGTAGIFFAALHFANYSLLSLIPFVLIFVLINFQRPAVVSYISSKFQHTYLATILSIESQISSLIAGGIALITGILADILGLSIAIGIVSIELVLLSLIKWFSENEDNNKKYS